MANTRKLWVNWVDKTLQYSDTLGTVVALPAFQKYETVPLQIVIVEPDPDSYGEFNRVDVSDMTLAVRINDTLDDASPLVEQTSWTKDTDQNCFTGNLVLNTAAFNTYIGSSDSLTAYFEIEAIEATARSKIYRAVVNLKQGVGTVTTTSPDPAQEYFTKEQQIGLFLQARLPPGVQITLVSEDSSATRTIGVSNNKEAIDIIP